MRIQSRRKQTRILLGGHPSTFRSSCLLAVQVTFSTSPLVNARQQLTLFRSTSRGLGYRHNNSFNCFHSRKVTAAACLYAIKITSSVLISINCEINPMFRRTSVRIFRITPRMRVLGVQKCRPFVEFPLMLTDLSRADDNLGDITVLGSANPLVEGE